MTTAPSPTTTTRSTGSRGTSPSILHHPHAPFLRHRRHPLVVLLLLLLISSSSSSSSSFAYSSRRRSSPASACSFRFGTAAANASSSSSTRTSGVIMPPSPPPSVPPSTAPATGAAEEYVTDATDDTVVASKTVVPRTDGEESESATDESASARRNGTTGTTNGKKKVLYLIRHAETVENVQTQSLIRTGRSLSRLTRPHRDDVRNGMSVLKSWVKGHADSGLSELGRRQVEKTGRVLQSEGGMDFLKTHGITTVAHSPLERARLTSAGVLGCVASPQDPAVEFVEEMKHEDVGRVVQLDCLREATPHELAIPRKKRTFYDRMREFERWVEDQDDGERIAVVGHSHFFMEMLNLSEKFRNCDVWKVEFSPSPSSPSSPAVEDGRGGLNGDSAREEGANSSASEKDDGELLQQSRRPSSSYGSTYSSPCRWSGLELVYRYEEDRNDDDGDGEVIRQD